MQLYLAEIAAIFSRVNKFLSPDHRARLSDLDDASRKAIADDAFDLTLRIDAVRDLLDEALLSAEVKLGNSAQARLYFDSIEPQREALSELWFAAMGLKPLTLEELGFYEEPAEPKPEARLHYISTISALLHWCVVRSEHYREDGLGDSDIILDNVIYDQTLNLLEASFFKPDHWYDRLRKIAPLVVNAQKLPRVIQERVRELHVTLIVGAPAACVVLARSTLEYALHERAPSHSVEGAEPGGEMKRLGKLIDAFADKRPDLELDCRTVKRIGDRAVHAHIGHKNVVTMYSVGLAEAFRSWVALKHVLQRLYA